jgi:hypothetical protein
MTYTKPEVVKLDSALSAIQGTEKPPETSKDTPVEYNATPGAYESDE